MPLRLSMIGAALWAPKHNVINYVGLLVTKVYFQLHVSLRFVSLFNGEAALAVQMSPARRSGPPAFFPVSWRASLPLLPLYFTSRRQWLSAYSVLGIVDISERKHEIPLSSQL